MADSSQTSAPPPGAKPIWGSYSGSGAPVRSGPSTPSGAPAPSDPLEPLSRRLLQLAGGLSLLLILVVANYFLHSEENPLNPMAIAAERTQSEPGARFTMKMTISSPAMPQQAAAHGSGAYNSETGLSEMTMKMDIPGKEPTALEMVADGTDVYMRSGELGALPHGKEWLKIQPFFGHSEEEVSIGSGDAGESLQILGTVSGGVRTMGREKVRGVPTQRYQATVEMTEIVELYREEGKDELADKYEEVAELMTAPVTVEASIDAKDIVRRVRTVSTIPTKPGKPTMTMDMQMDLFGFGARPEIALPGPSQVLDATEFEEQLESVES